jgi:hypothetical protein
MTSPGPSNNLDPYHRMLQLDNTRSYEDMKMSDPRYIISISFSPSQYLKRMTRGKQTPVIFVWKDVEVKFFLLVIYLYI